MKLNKVPRVIATHVAPASVTIEKAKAQVDLGPDAKANGPRWAPTADQLREAREAFARGIRIGNTVYGGSSSAIAQARALANRAGKLAKAESGTAHGDELLRLESELQSFVTRASSSARGGADGFHSLSNAQVASWFDQVIADLSSLRDVATSRLSAEIVDSLELVDRLDGTIAKITAAKAELAGIDDLKSGIALEAELKLMVPSEAILEKIELGLGAPERTLFQENLYYDREGRLSAAHWSLRLRTEDGEALLTLKGPRLGPVDATLVVRPESPQVRITVAEVAAIKAGRIDPLELLSRGLAGKPEHAYVDEARALLGGVPTLTAGITNERRVYPVLVAGRKLAVEVDRSDYGHHGRFFELELEMPAHLSVTTKRDVESWFTELVATHGVAPERGPGKHARLNYLLSTSNNTQSGTIKVA